MTRHSINKYVNFNAMTVLSRGFSFEFMAFIVSADFTIWSSTLVATFARNYPEILLVFTVKRLRGMPQLELVTPNSSIRDNKQKYTVPHAALLSRLFFFLSPMRMDT